MSIFLAILLLGACAHAFDPFLADPLEIALAIRLTGNNRSFGMQPPTGVPPGHQPATSIPHNSSVLAAVTRDEVMKCAMQWVQEKVPYCQCSGGPSSECCGQCPHCGTTRCDCSGFVSYCWGLRVGYTTGTIPNIATRITKAQLQKGDVMLYPADHVAFFGGWCDESQTTFFAIQEPGCHTEGPHYAFAQCIQYPFNWNPQDFSPYRYHGIRD